MYRTPRIRCVHTGRRSDRPTRPAGVQELNDLRQDIFGPDDQQTDLRDILTKRKLATKAIQLIEQAEKLGQNRIAEEETRSSIEGGL